MADVAPITQQPFYFLRHGETDLNRLGLITGQTDVGLNDTGWGQARAAAKLLADRGIDAIYASPLKRVRETAGCAAAVLGLEVVLVPQLVERGWGALEGMPRTLRVRGATPPGGEAPEAFALRTLAGVASIPPARLPLIVAHSGTFRVLCDELDLPRRDKPIANAHPLYLVPPSAAAQQWSVIELQ